MLGQTDVALGHEDSNMTDSKKKNTATASKWKKRGKKTDFTKPCIEEITDTEERPGPNEHLHVETIKDTKSSH